MPESHRKNSPNVSLQRKSNGDDQLQAYRLCCLQDLNRKEVIEWLSALTLFFIGQYMLIFPAAVLSSHMVLITSTVANEVAGFICATLGGVRLSFLVKRNTEANMRVRAILAALSATVWLEMCVAFFARFYGEVPPPGFIMLLVYQFGGDAWLTYRIRCHLTLLTQKGVL